ncbi:MAG TPA: TRAP transporter TatT component family protein, partial [Kofleriaceae bacterium]|nr:TRAP transporter TatT component family protein [Kofleriaceae bacterium]
LTYPHHRGLRRLHADALCQYAIGFLFDDWDDAALLGRADEAARLATRLHPLLAACADANLGLLSPAWREARARGGDAWDAQLRAATAADVPPLLWIASSDAVELALEPLRHLGDVGTLTATLARCVALRPGFHDADGELLLGTLEAGRSRFLGGPDGEAWFARARAAAGDGALLVDVLHARATLVARGDRAVVQAALERVVAAELSRWPERRLANELAVRKARRYLAALDRLVGAAPRGPSAGDGPYGTEPRELRARQP